MPGNTSSATAPNDTAPRYDDSAWPLFTIEMPPERMSPPMFEAHLAACRSVFERGEPFLLLLDMAEHPALTASQRYDLAEAMQRDCGRYPGLCRSMAVVVRSSFERSVIQAVHSMSRPSYPFAIFSSIAEAKAWLASKKMPGSQAPYRFKSELSSPPALHSHSSTPPFSQARRSLAPFSRRAPESPLPPSTVRFDVPAPSSRTSPALAVSLSRRPREST